MVTSLVIFMSSARPVHLGAFVTPRLLKVGLDGFQKGSSLPLFNPHRLLDISILTLALCLYCVPDCHTVSTRGSSPWRGGGVQGQMRGRELMVRYR